MVISTRGIGHGERIICKNVNKKDSIQKVLWTNLFIWKILQAGHCEELLDVTLFICW